MGSNAINSPVEEIIPADHPHFDAIIVGAGFSGLHVLNKTRKQNFRVKLFEAGSDLGGVWYWNCYPGARVDFSCQTYQFTQDGLWKDFQWTERYPAQPELRKYFEHVNKKLNLTKDIQFNTRVTDAIFSDTRSQWLVMTNDSEQYWATHLILCTGLQSKRYTPDFKGLDEFKGQWVHTAAWPQGGLDFKGKRVAVIGTGASGVQVIQETGSQASHLTVFQRTPNLTFPMRQYSMAEKDKWFYPEDQEAIFAKQRRTFGADYVDSVDMNTFEASAEERNAHYLELYRMGGLAFHLGNYKDLVTNEEANAAAYKFWLEQTRPRITDPVKRDLLAPLVAPFFLATKRSSLEQNYYEVLSQSNVDIINVKESPIIRITPDGIETEKKGLTEVDLIIFATGFDSLTGGILEINITNGNLETLQDKWKTGGVSTNLGMTTSGFPNMYFLLGPQSPSATSIGPVCAEIQGDWLVELLSKMRDEECFRIEATVEAELAWVQNLRDIFNSTLLPQAASWYRGSNIPGKTIEPLIYLGGIPNYIQALEECKKDDYKGFVFNK